MNAVTIGDKERARIKEIELDSHGKYGRKLTKWERKFIDDLYQSSLLSTQLTLTWSVKQQEALSAIEWKMYQ